MIWFLVQTELFLGFAIECSARACLTIRKNFFRQAIRNLIFRQIQTERTDSIKIPSTFGQKATICLSRFLILTEVLHARYLCLLKAKIRLHRSKTENRWKTFLKKTFRIL
ncbi:hypothetical protein D9M72_507230 [compost metagenome]